MFRISHIRAVSNDKRLTQGQIEAVLAKTSLPAITRRVVTDAFAEAGQLSDGQIKAAAVSVDGEGRYSVPSIDGALGKCPVLKDYERIEIKSLLARYALLK
jgi:hypothetical protein